jgi:hypothetical protein
LSLVGKRATWLAEAALPPADFVVYSTAAGWDSSERTGDVPGKEEMIQALAGVNERIDRLAASIAANPEAKLATGTWTVRDVLCHLAARSNGVPGFVNRIKRLLEASGGGAPPARPAGLNIDDINQSQIDERQGRGVEELLTEIKDGHLAAIEALKDVDEGLLGRMVPNFRGDGEVEASSMLLGGTARHDNNHLDEIEKALEGVRT